MDIKKAIVTAAGKNQPTLPLQTLVDRDGGQKTALTIILGRSAQGGHRRNLRGGSSGRDQAAYRAAAGAHAGRVQFIEQIKPLGYGQAVQCARDFIGEPAIFASGRRSSLREPRFEKLRAATG